MTRRRWIADRWTENSATLLEEQAAHLARVLRAQVGQEFDIVTGHAVRRGVVEKVAADAVEFSLHEEVQGGEALPLIVGLSIVRFERMEWAIEKLTELGVERIIPLIAQRSEKHLVQSATKRCERWRKISRESAQQSRRSDVPEISDPMPLKDCIAASENSLRYLFSEEERSRSLWESLMTTDRKVMSSTKIYVAIGPEGGWTSAELSSFSENGWQSVSLGKNILRTETAAIAAANLIGAWWNG